MSDDKLKEPKEDEDALAGEDGEEGGEGEEGGKDKKKLILMIAVPIVLLLGGGAAAFFTGALDGLLGRDAAVEEMVDGEHSDDAHGAPADDGHGGKKEKKKKAKDSHGEADSHGESAGGHKEGSVVFLEIPKMIVSLSSDDDQPRYLSLSVQLELETTDDREAIEDVMPRVVDQFQSFLRELRVQDLRGTKGLYRLKLELLGRVNAAAYPVEVKNILLQDMIVQ
jgi:flagellar FliL protein